VAAFCSLLFEIARVLGRGLSNLEAPSFELHYFCEGDDPETQLNLHFEKVLSLWYEEEKTELSGSAEPRASDHAD
jgi:hypothetical protein